MRIENKQVLSEFIYNDRFELNAYLNYIFHQFHNNLSAELKGANKQ